MDASHDWDAYARLQTDLEKRGDVDDIAWGLEAGLNQLLMSSVDDVRRTVRSSARQDRHRARLLMIERLANPGVVEPEFAVTVDQRHAIADVRSRVSEGDWQMLRLRAAGYSYAAIGRELGTTAGALRVRFGRLKQALRSRSKPLRRSA